MKCPIPLAALAAFASLAVPNAAPAAARKPVESGAPLHERNGAPVVRVNAVNQGYDFARPWAKKNPYPRRGTGAILDDGKVLVTAELVADNSMVEIEIPRNGLRIPAEIAAIDYDANLALLVPSDPGPVEELGAFTLDRGARVGDKAEILQVENNGEIARTAGTVTTIGVFPYPNETLAALMFRVSAPLQSRDSSFVLPAERNGRLLGLLMRYDARTQTADLVPPSLIARFLKNAASDEPHGFPKAGIAFSPLRDPQLRAHLGVPGEGGVYVTDVLPESPAAKAGLRKGDVVIEADGHPLDQDGLYDDDEFGKILFSHLVALAEPGRPLELEIWRDGKPESVSVMPESPDPQEAISPPYFFDDAPRYVVLGGLVFQELNRSFLRQWGGNWRQNAPQRLVYLDAFQSELPADRGKIVFLSGILPSDDTIGYSGLENLVVTEVNDRPIKGLEDLLDALESPSGQFHKIAFEEDPGVIYLDAPSVAANRSRLAEDYGIPAMTNVLEDKPEPAKPAGGNKPTAPVGD